MTTKIEWTQETWNPIIGCSKISEGCQNCYAEKFAIRLADNPKTGYYDNVVKGQPFDPGTGWNGNTYFVESALEKPFKWKKPRMIFVCSMGDLFHESVPFEWIDKVFRIIYCNPQHTYQILTKRPKIMYVYFKYYAQQIKDVGLDSVPSQSANILDYIDIPDFIWLGVTCENQKTADERIPILLQIPAKVRFVSCEPLLGRINLIEAMNVSYKDFMDDYKNYGIDWIICGKETGAKARPMLKSWIESLYDQCLDLKIPFFDKRNELGLNIQQYPK